MKQKGPIVKTVFSAIDTIISFIKDIHRNIARGTDDKMKNTFRGVEEIVQSLFK